eukprot:5933138-Prymnesium_polylepis.1
MERRYGPKRAGAWLRESLSKALAKAERAKARSENLSIKLRRLRKWPPCGRAKAAKVTYHPRRP